MIKMWTVVVISAALFASAVPVYATPAEEREHARIERLLTWLSGQQGTLSRNGKDYSIAAGVKHLRRKKAFYFRNHPVSVEAFIQDVASHSWKTKQPYVWKTPDGTLVPCADMWRRALNEIDAQNTTLVKSSKEL